jgi:hypothetical protein
MAKDRPSRRVERVVLSLLAFVVPAFADVRIEVRSLNFYASDGSEIAREKRTYSTLFPRAYTRYIWSELTIVHPAPGTEKTIEVDCAYYYPWGEQVGQVHLRYNMQPSWGAAYSEKSLGWAERKWPAGVYLVDCNAGGSRIAAATFQVTDDTSPTLSAPSPHASVTTPQPPADEPPELDLSSLPDSGIDLAVVRAREGTLRERAASDSTALLSLKRGTVLALLNREPKEGFYNVIEIDAGKEGWVSRNDLQIRLTKNPRKESMFKDIETGTTADPQLLIINDSGKVLTVRVGSETYVIDPGGRRQMTLKPGTYPVYASAPGVLPNFGDETFKAGVDRSLRFYIEKRPK